MTAQPKTYYTPEQYLEREREAEYKSEYHKGEVFAMAGASPNHSRITENLSIEVGIHLRGSSCRGYSSDLRLHIPDATFYTYPDLLVICGPNQYADPKRDTVTNPTLLIEVLSKSTESYDRGAKFALYRRIPTITEYMLIDSQTLRAEVFRKGENGFWFLASEAQSISESIHLASIDLTINMPTAYADTEGLLPAT